MYCMYVCNFGAVAIDQIFQDSSWQILVCLFKSMISFTKKKAYITLICQVDFAQCIIRIEAIDESIHYLDSISLYSSPFIM